jgi:hypothetical protein
LFVRWQEKERLALNVDELNDIVFSKTFQPPSAWADRERKYKMEKRDWETDVRAPSSLTAMPESRLGGTSASSIKRREMLRVLDKRCAAPAR